MSDGLNLTGFNEVKDSGSNNLDLNPTGNLQVLRQWFMKIHLISLNQDLEGDYNVQSKINIQGQIMATEHLLSVATDIMNENERV